MTIRTPMMISYTWCWWYYLLAWIGCVILHHWRIHFKKVQLHLQTYKLRNSVKDRLGIAFMKLFHQQWGIWIIRAIHVCTYDVVLAVLDSMHHNKGKHVYNPYTWVLLLPCFSIDKPEVTMDTKSTVIFNRYYKCNQKNSSFQKIVAVEGKFREWTS